MKVYPVKLFSQSIASKCINKIKFIVNSWVVEWKGSSLDVEINICNISDSLDREKEDSSIKFEIRREDAVDIMLLSIGDFGCARLCELFSGNSGIDVRNLSKSKFMYEAGASAFFDLICKVAQVGSENVVPTANGVLSDVLPEELSIPFTPYLCIGVKISDLIFSIYLRPENYFTEQKNDQVSLEKIVGLTKRDDALGNQFVKLSALLGEVFVPVATLSSLSINDVLMLNKQVSDPVDIVVDDVCKVMTAYLGKNGEFKAVQIDQKIH